MQMCSGGSISPHLSYLSLHQESKVNIRIEGYFFYVLCCFWFLSGASLQRQGKYKDAIQYHSRVLKISKQTGEDSGTTEAYGAIADCYTELGDLERAGKFYDKYIARLESDWWIAQLCASSFCCFVESRRSAELSCLERCNVGHACGIFSFLVYGYAVSIVFAWIPS